MNAKTTVPLLFGGYLLYRVIQRNAAAKNLNFYPDATGITATMQGATPVINFRLAIQNVSSESATFKSIVGNVWANGYLIGNVNSYTAVQIGPRSTSYIPLTVRLSLVGIATDIFNSIANKTGLTQLLELQATVNVNDFLIPIKIPYKIG